MTGELRQRKGDRPATTPTNPHSQLDQNAPEGLQEILWLRMAGLRGVETGHSLVSVPGARAIFVGDAEPCCMHCCMEGREFAHIHPREDGSLHVVLPARLRAEAFEKSWAEPHPLVKRGLVPECVVMLYGPRDREELETVWSLVLASHDYATGGIADSQ